MIAKAEVTQSDLKNAEQYGYNYYDLGDIDFTVKGIIKKSPQAVIAGLFRPFIWEVRTAFAIIAGLENFILLLFVFFLIIRLGIFSFFRTIFNSPLLTFSFFFAILFAFSIGISNANFGALVRYKIPLLPFFLASLFILLTESKNKKSEDFDLNKD